MTELKTQNILFICTSGKDRSPALVEYFSSTTPHNNYKCAGINKYFCTKKGTHLINEEDIEWAHVLVFAEDIHLKVVGERFEAATTNSGDFILFSKLSLVKPFMVLSCGDYTQGAVGEDYLLKAEAVLIKNKIILSEQFK